MNGGNVRHMQAKLVQEQDRLRLEVGVVSPLSPDEL
jgi:hypothetical protein